MPQISSDADHIGNLIQIGSDPKSIKKVQALAAKTIKALGVPGLVYPSKSCAAVLSHFLNEAGIDVPITTGAQKLADRIRVNRGWDVVKVGKQQPGDVGVCFSVSDDVAGADHIYLVVERKDSDLMVVADNQAQGTTHTRTASGKGGKVPKTPTEYFLRAPQGGGVERFLAADRGDAGGLPDENTNNLPEPFMDDGSTRLMDEDGSPRFIF
jgi:hypothetical protein